MNTKTDLTVGGDQLPPLIPRTMNRLTAPKSGPAAMLRLHRWIYARSDGRVGAGMIGAWTLLLRTVGRRTGQPRLTALVLRGTGKRSLWPPRTTERITHRPGSTTCAPDRKSKSRWVAGGSLEGPRSSTRRIPTIHGSGNS